MWNGKYKIRLSGRTGARFDRPASARARLGFLVMLVLFELAHASAASAQPGIRLPWLSPPVGEQVVRDILFEGNEAYGDLVLIEQLAHKPQSVLHVVTGSVQETYFRGGELSQDLEALSAYYRERGYHKARVTVRILPTDRTDQVDLLFMVDEGPPIRIESIHVGLQAPDSVVRRLMATPDYRDAIKTQPYQPGSVLHGGRRRESLDAFTRVLRENGHAFGSVRLESNIDSARNLAMLDFQLIPGPYFRVGEIQVSGNESVSRDYIVRQSGIEKGDPFRLSRLERAREILASHPLLEGSAIEVKESLSARAVDLRIVVLERPLRSIELTGGVGTEDILRVRSVWQHRNVNGRAHVVSAAARVSFIEQQLSGEYFIPYVFNNRSSYVFTPFVEHVFGPRKAYELFRGGFRHSVVHRSSAEFNSTFTHEISRNQQLDGRREIRLPDSLRNYNVSAFSVMANYGKGIGEGQGWEAAGLAEISSPFGLTPYRYFKARVSLSRHAPLDLRHMVSARIHAGGILQVDGDSLPPNIRFYTGGTQTVRGWGRQVLGPKRAVFVSDSTLGPQFDRYVPLGGRMMLAASLEARRDLTGLRLEGLGAAAFIDAGQVWNSFDDLKRRPVRFALGFGIRYRSPIGPVQLDLAWKANPSDQDLNRYQGVDYGSLWNRFGLHLRVGGVQ